jgi:ribosomal protein S18 acetylase RimI-like enzyme
MNQLKIIFRQRVKQKSDYDWADLEYGEFRVGKARCLINGNDFTIFTITVYPEYQNNGYGREFVERAKKQYKRIIADSVRFNAIGFWENVGFIKDGETMNWVFETV